MFVVKKAQQVEIIEQEGLDLTLFRKKGNSKTFKGWLIQKMKEARKDTNLDVAQILQTVYKELLKYEEMEKIRVESWRKKGGIQLFNRPNTIVVEFASQRDKDEKPNIKKAEYSKSEINNMIICINKLKDQYKNKIPSRALGEMFYGGDWDLTVFSQRTDHTKFTHLLNILDFYKIIKYNRRGFTSVLRPVKEIQEVLV